MAVTKTISEITINKIRIGGKAPKAIYKGEVEVKKVTKGSTVIYQKEDVSYVLNAQQTTSELAQSGGTAGLLFQSTRNGVNFDNLTASKGSANWITLSGFTLTTIPNIGDRYKINWTAASAVNSVNTISPISVTGSRSQNIIITQGVSGLSCLTTVKQYWDGIHIYTVTYSQSTGVCTFYMKSFSKGTLEKEIYYNTSSDNNISSFNLVWRNGGPSGAYLYPTYNKTGTMFNILATFSSSRPSTLWLQATYNGKTSS